MITVNDRDRQLHSKSDYSLVENGNFSSMTMSIIPQYLDEHVAVDGKSKYFPSLANL